MYIIGHNPCMSCIAHNPSKIRTIFVTKEKKEEYLLNILDKNIRKKINLIKKSEFMKIHKGISQNDSIAIERENFISSPINEIISNPGEPSTIIILDQLTDQNNIGNIFRTAALTDVNGIIIPEHSSGGITSITASISTGAVEIVKFHIAKNISRTVEILKKKIIGFIH